MKVYTEIYPIRFSKEEKIILNKLKERKVKVPKFIREAIKEKIERDYLELI